MSGFGKDPDIKYTKGKLLDEPEEANRIPLARKFQIGMSIENLLNNRNWNEA